MARQTTPTIAPKADTVLVKRNNGKIWSPVREMWLIETPEERVRQEFLPVLVNEYGYGLNQIAEEMELTGRGSGHARADFVIWRTPHDKADKNQPLIIVECKSDNVTIRAEDYHQGDNYARIAHAPFVVTHNSKETKFWRVMAEKMPGHLQEIGGIPKAGDSDAEIQKAISELKVFKENEFANLLHKCHNIIRNREKKDPAAAFDEIAKILFIKVWSERQMREQRQRENRFTTDVLDRQLSVNPLQTLFDQVKIAYQRDAIFGEKDEIHLRPETGRAIVQELQVYNLSDTSEDIKGIAFERFLGRTFRGEIGQFFTPRSIVEFMIHMVEPREGDVICDPASGSGGFLIRFFEIVREQILADVDRQYATFKTKTDADETLSPEAKAAALRAEYDRLQHDLMPHAPGSRLWNLANRCIYGTDANDRMARTSKMNMIMHGDGHGGVHHHDGFLNVNGIFEGRFSVILTNPPFGATVEESDYVSDPKLSPDVEQHYKDEYGEPYVQAMKRRRDFAAKEKPSIAKMFSLPRGNASAKTEILFIERCLDLLRPGGRLGIVLPEGIFNNPSLSYVREFCEDRAFIRAIVSLPPETFVASGASVKTSLLFMQKFTLEEQADYDEQLMKTRLEIEQKHAPRGQEIRQRLEEEIASAKAARDGERRKSAQAELTTFEKAEKQRQQKEARALHKERWAYPIFLYEADAVGITATGEDDYDEFYRYPAGSGHKGLPPGVEESTFEIYQQFRADPQAFFTDAEAIEESETEAGQ